MKRKIVIAVIIVVALAILFTPARIQLRDGGSVVYKAITYSVTKYRNYETRVWKIVIFGITLRDDLEEVRKYHEWTGSL